MPPTQFGVFQDVLTQFQTVTATWLGGLYQIGASLFYMLAAIELILVGITGTLRRDFDQLAIDLVRTIAGVMAMFTLFKYGPDFLQNGVILSFVGWASVTGHVPASAMTPGGVMAQGFNLALILLQAIASGWTVFHPSATLNALLLLFSAIVILVCFAIVACILLETLVEGYVACVAGTALVATSGTRFTWRFGEGYFGWALGVAVRIFFLYLMVGVGTQLAIRWTKDASGNAGYLMTNWYYGIEAAVEAFLLAVITARIPTKAAQIVDHTVSSTLGDIILGMTLSGAIRDGVKAIPKALEVSGKLGGEAFNGVLNLADEGATRAMRMWDRIRNDQLKPPAPPTAADLDPKRTTQLGGGGAETRPFNRPVQFGQPAPATSRLNHNGKGTKKL